MKSLISIIFLSILMFVASSCNDWLMEKNPASSDVDEYFLAGAQACINNITGCYSPLQWEFNKTYYPEWFIGDVCSDDAVKGGGSREDMSSVLEMENFMTIPDNDFLLDFYRAQYQGIARCNFAIKYIAEAAIDTVLTQSLKNRLLGEAHFLRAMYYFRLVRVFGGTAMVVTPLMTDSEWRQPRASMSDIYGLIFSDLKFASATLWRKEDYPATDMGRATKGAALAMLLKANLYRAGWIQAGFMDGDANEYYQQAKLYGDTLINHQNIAGAYSLVSNYWDNFTIAGENGPESVFEVQYSEDPQGDYGSGNGFSRGSFTTIITRSRSSIISGSPTGWGFNKPTRNLFDEFEVSNGVADPRRDLTIWDPDVSLMTNPDIEVYMGNSYLSCKYAMYKDGPSGGLYELTHPSRGPINIKVIRYSDVLLLYAEACAATDDLTNAKNALNEVRRRARGINTNILSDFPYGTYSENAADLTKAIRHERRVELAMENHRWFDLCRWGIVSDVMETYRTTPSMENAEVQAEMKPFSKGKHELFPIPREEMNLNGYTQADQNAGY